MIWSAPLGLRLLSVSENCLQASALHLLWWQWELLMTISAVLWNNQVERCFFFLCACKGSGFFFFCYVNRNYFFKILFLYSEDMWALRSAKKRNVMMQKPENHRAAAGCHSDDFVWLKIKVMYIEWQEWVTGMAMTQVVAMNSLRNVKWWAPTVAVL